MQNKLNKKGVATVVTIVLLILISIVALGILWVSIKTNLDLSPLPCTTSQINQLISIEKSCYDSENQVIITKLKRGLIKTEINSLEFIVSLENKKANYICDGPFGNICGLTCIPPEQPGLTKEFYLNLEEGGQNPLSLTVKANGCALEHKEISIC